MDMLIPARTAVVAVNATAPLEQASASPENATQQVMSAHSYNGAIRWTH